MKLYGFSKILNFPCICYGARGYFFKIGWSKKDKRFRVYKGHIYSDQIVRQCAQPKKWFFGFMINDSEEEFFAYFF